MEDENIDATLTPSVKVDSGSDQNGVFVLAAIVWVLFIGGVVMYIIMRERKKFEQQLKSAQQANDEIKPENVTAKEVEKEETETEQEE